MSGIGLGTFLYPFIANALIDFYGWRGALIFTSAFTLNISVCGMLIGPDEITSPSNSQSQQRSGDCKPPNDHGRQVSINPTSKWHSFTRLNYWLLLVHMILTCFGQSITMTHIIPYAEHNAHSAVFAASLVASCGLSSLAGRTVHGLIIHHPQVNTRLYYIFCFVIVGLSMFTMAIWTSAPVLMVAMVILGYFYASWGPVLAEVLMEVGGPDDFSYGYGFLMMAAGFGYMLGAPCAGQCYKTALVTQCNGNCKSSYSSKSKCNSSYTSS